MSAILSNQKKRFRIDHVLCVADQSVRHYTEGPKCGVAINVEK
jgi:hypothetical protein